MTLMILWKVIATVGLDKKMYVFDSGSRRPSFVIPYEAPFSSLSFTDDGLTLAAGTSSGRIVFYDVRGKPQPLTVLRAFGNSEVMILFIYLFWHISIVKSYILFYVWCIWYVWTYKHLPEFFIPSGCIFSSEIAEF